MVENCSLLVALNIIDESKYDRYRTHMAPVLAQYGGHFTVDYQIKTVLPAEVTGPLTRLFILSFPSVEQKQQFLEDKSYKYYRESYFAPSIDKVVILNEEPIKQDDRYHMFVAMNVVSPEDYQNYRTAMRPILQEYNGGFLLDCEVRSLTDSFSHAHTNRAFVIYFGNESQRNQFYRDERYKQIVTDIRKDAVANRALLKEF
jgi:uncharacterized protein (DUF1330 family)